MHFCVSSIGWVLDRGEAMGPVDGATGRATRILGVLIDITGRKRHEEQIKLLMREVNHRSKNLLSVVQAVARQTAAANSDDFLGRFGERIQALAASQDLLVKGAWIGVDLEELARSQLAHFKDLIGPRIELRGPPLLVCPSAAQAIGMALHELATNAGKYGALSTASGQVKVHWSLERSKGHEKTFVISSRESGGPAVVPPSRQGFGSTVISRLAEESLDATVELDYKPAGLIWRLQCPEGQLVERRNHPPARQSAKCGGNNTQLSVRPRILVVEDEALTALQIEQSLYRRGV